MAKGQYKVPFTPGKGMARYGNAEVDNYVFSEVLGIDFITTTRSSAIVHLVSVITENRYTMFVTEFNELLRAKKFKNGCINGSFTFVKRGNSFGIRLLSDEEKKCSTP
jgi:hypothetical protein